MSPSKVASTINQLGIKGLGQLSYASAAAAFAPAPMGARVCGVVSAYTPATAAAGSLKIGGLTFTIAPGAALKGVFAGQDSCFTFCFDDQGRISGQDGNVSAGQGLPQVCGIVTKFSASVGGVNGSVTIGGANIRLAQGTYFSGQDQVAPGSNSCLIPAGFGDLAGAGSFFIQNSSPKQVRVPALVRGQTFDSQEDTFYLPEPTILTLDSDQASVFTVGQNTFGKVFSSDHRKVEGFSYSTPNSKLQAVSCNESFWDIEFEIAGSGTTEGDMVTISLLNSDKSVAQQIAMFTIQGGGALLTQLHPDVKLNASLMSTKGAGYFAPFILSAGASGLRTVPLALVFDPSSKSLNGCFQLAVEIKRAGGAGTTTVVIENIIVKRMERSGDRGVSIGYGLMNGSLGWFPTGRVCDFICWPCRAENPTQQSLSGYVYCDSNNNGVRDAGENGIPNVTINLSGTQNQTAATNGDGFYQFDVSPGTYTVTEVQPATSPVTGDGIDTVGSCSGNAGNDVISGIPVAANAHCVNYNFGEQCNVVSTKCDTICWRSTQYFITYIRNLPGGTVLIYGVNGNNPVGNQSSNNAVRQALYGGQSVTQRFNKEYVTGQLSISYAGGSGSPVTFNTFWSPLTCSGISFAPVTLSNGITLSPSSLLDTLVTQSNLAIRENRTQDMGALASIWALLNGRCG
jgi:hypothetical protein